MKVGTDGVLLGAWCDVHNRTRILDIGTGTGLIALMLAQRNQGASITAIEPNPDAAADARANFAMSPFREKCTLLETLLQDYNPDTNFDLIVSNPPFFQNSLQNPDPGRTQARHTSGFSPEDLAATTRWLSPKGKLAGIYPADVFEEFQDFAAKAGLFPTRKMTVYPNPEKPAHRILFEFSRFQAPTETEELTIETNGRHQFGEKYMALTRDFYLKF